MDQSGSHNVFITTVCLKTLLLTVTYRYQLGEWEVGRQRILCQDIQIPFISSTFFFRHILLLVSPLTILLITVYIYYLMIINKSNFLLMYPFISI